MSFRRSFYIALGLGLPLLVGSMAHATTVERVVAVVGEHAILQSELRQRARPFLAQIYVKMPPGAQQAAAEYELNKQLLQRMIEDRLQTDAAVKHKIQVTSKEVDSAIERLASVQNITVDQLLHEVQRSGMTPQEYREELRRQILEGKLLELRVKGQVRVTEEDMHAMYDRLSREERRQLGYRLQWLVLRMPQGATPQERADRRKFAQDLAKQAHTEQDFARLVARFSEDPATKEHGGDLGHQDPGALDETIERVAQSLEVGQVAAPFPYADAIIIIRLAERDPSRLGTFDQARDQIAQRVYADQLEKAKRRWIEGLKRGVHIDVRL